MDEELKAIARSLVWWKPPEEVGRTYLVRRIMDSGTPEMVRHVRERFGENVMRHTLVTAEPGEFVEASWHYWHTVFGISPVPPLPVRQIPDSPLVSEEIKRSAAARVAGNAARASKDEALIRRSEPWPWDVRSNLR